MITPSTVDNDYNNDVAIKIPDSSICVFQNTVEYTIFFCPSPDLDDVSKNRCSRDDRKMGSSKAIAAKLNLFAGDLGDRFPGTWYATVCTGKSLSDCKKTIFATGSVSAIADTTPTPPPDLPIIDALAQPKCIFQVGESVTLTATNITSGREYQWWWNGSSPHYIGTATGSSLTFTIGDGETNQAGVRNVCIEDKIGSRTKNQSQNCISLEFTPTTPAGNTSCKKINSGTDYFKLQGDDFPVLPPPCAEFDASGKKCLAVDTAIGIISTEPQAFVRSIFNLVLGLAGGIALILIIISGYKFMASSGNPEATKAATEQLTSAIIGLLFIIFAFVILEMIGVDILKIPGFKP